VGTLGVIILDSKKHTLKPSTKNEVKDCLKKAYDDNTLLSPKHDPNNLGTIFEKYRTVVSCEVAQNLQVRV